MNKVSLGLAAFLLLAGGRLPVASATLPTSFSLAARFPDVPSRNAFFRGKQDATDWYNATARSQADIQAEFAYAMDNRMAAEDGSLEDFYWSGYSEQIRSYCTSGC